MIHIVHLYPKEMNIYGDTGNLLVLKKRLEWRGIKYKVSFVGIGDEIPSDADFILGGGGQDAGQALVQSDLAKKETVLKNMANDNVVMLMVCGMYQLFGHKFVTTEKDEIKGIGILPLSTKAGSKRFIGNIVISTKWGEIVGYENHSGLTELELGAEPLGKVIKGSGNNGQDKSEGCVINNIFGTYCHGPILTKNPAFADELLRRALVHAGIKAEFSPLDDELEIAASWVAKKRPV